jgi:hypothetical protein
MADTRTRDHVRAILLKAIADQRIPSRGNRADLSKGQTMTQLLKLTIQLTYDNSGPLDADFVEGNVDAALQLFAHDGRLDGSDGNHDDPHAKYVSHSVSIQEPPPPPLRHGKT